jgi:hypothetical protein
MHTDDSISPRNIQTDRLAMSQVQLGFIDDAEHPAHLLRQFFPSKVGGRPVRSAAASTATRRSSGGHPAV